MRSEAGVSQNRNSTHCVGPQGKNYTDRNGRGKAEASFTHSKRFATFDALKKGRDLRAFAVEDSDRTLREVTAVKWASQGHEGDESGEAFGVLRLAGALE